jgi:hypothetical protein
MDELGDTVFGKEILRTRKGFALVLVLSLTALMLIMLLGILSVSQTEYEATKDYHGSASARALADSAVNIALAQLHAGTSEEFSDATPKPWTSQPGAIRVHDMSGKLQTLYKLYSGTQMRMDRTNLEDDQLQTDLAADLPGSWRQNAESFVDLNAPEWDARRGDYYFPICDPRGKSDDPLQSVEGFDYSQLGGDRVGFDLPMPVRWLYVLRDGSLGTMDSAGIINAAGGGIPTSANPVVGRIAFWVDDESCKVNINTAAEGAFWDTPKADTTQERYLATHQPSRLEYARLPGHPAGVCLSSVLLPHKRHYPMGFLAAENDMVAMEAGDLSLLWSLGRQAIVESSDGTSLGGVLSTDWEALWPTNPTVESRQTRYINVDEMAFDNRIETNGLASRRISGFMQADPERIKQLARRRFFLTADSSAPETTLFGTPRIAMWPVHAAAKQNLGSGVVDPLRKDSAYDHKMLYATTLAGRSWVVQRSEPGNGAKDLEVHASGANKTMLDYLRRLTSRPVPGFYSPKTAQTTFEAKYGEDRESILLQMLDTLRTSNLADGQLEKNHQFSILCPGVEHHGFGQVGPLQPRIKGSAAGTSDHAQGSGRFLTVSEVALCIVCKAERLASGELVGAIDAGTATRLPRPGDREIEVMFLVETFVPGQGWADFRPWASISLVGGKPGTTPDTGNTMPILKLNGVELQRQSAFIESDDVPPKDWSVSGGATGLRSLPVGLISFKPIVIPGTNEGQAPELHFEGASDSENQLKLAVYDSPSGAGAGKYGTDDLVQVIPLKLPDITPADGLKLPSIPQDLTRFTLKDRWKESIERSAPVISKQDIVQSLAPLHGDYRLMATQRWLESKSNARAVPLFQPHVSWGKKNQAHDLQDQTLRTTASDGPGYIAGLDFASARLPDLPSTLANVIIRSSSDMRFWNGIAWETNTFNNVVDRFRLDNGRRGEILPAITGDFDNGVGNAADGPMLHRPDDGHWLAATTGKVPYFDRMPLEASVPPVSPATFSAQRLLPSPVVFGGVSTGSRVHVPWQTLLFRPQPQHYGNETPPDHLLMDLFYAPVIEPELLSYRLETQGKINLNHQLVPFTHIQRATALHAAMKAETVMAIPDSAASTYKTGGTPENRFRLYIDSKATLDLIQQKVFSHGKTFLTASQLCEHHLIPTGLIPADANAQQSLVDDFWAQHRLTGDNAKEQPYSHLYSRLTTRSNTYRVHFVVQSLKKARTSSPHSFDSRRDNVLSTVRGSALIKRSIKSDDNDFPDLMLEPNPHAAEPSKRMQQFVRWHIEAYQSR